MTTVVCKVSEDHRIEVPVDFLTECIIEKVLEEEHDFSVSFLLKDGTMIDLCSIHSFVVEWEEQDEISAKF